MPSPWGSFSNPGKIHKSRSPWKDASFPLAAEMFLMAMHCSLPLLAGRDLRGCQLTHQLTGTAVAPGEGGCRGASLRTTTHRFFWLAADKVTAQWQIFCTMYWVSGQYRDEWELKASGFLAGGSFPGDWREGAAPPLLFPSLWLNSKRAGRIFQT